MKSSLQNSQENDWKNFTTLHGLVTCLIQLQSKHPSRESNTSSSSTSAAAAAPSSSLAHLEPNTEKRFAEFKSWLEENEFPAHPLEFVHVGGVEGNGAVAKRDIAEGELFLKVPHKFLITTETAEAASYMSSLLNSDFVTGGLLSRVKNVLLSVHLACELKRGASSFWSPYIDILPRTFTLPLFFSLEEISLLKGSPAFQEVINLFTTLVKQYIFLRKVLLLQAAILDHLKFDEQQEPEDEDEGQTRFPILLKDFTFELFRWAASIVMTRQNKIIVGGTNESPEYGFALIPVWDMCNHGVDTTSTIYDTATETIECVAKKPVSAGQPVLLFYGPRSNLDFFVYSGFVFQDNPYDHYRLTLGVSKLDALYNEKMKIISAVGMKE